MRKASEFELKDLVGKKVRSLKEFSGIPIGTEGVVDEDYGRGIMVKWTTSQGCVVRDGFGRDDKFDETQWLEVIE